ncbi:MAG: metallophosphoesterase family protein [Litorilinea sp.]
MKIAILADIHGNLPALESVMADMENEAPDLVYVAGDLVNRCPWSNEVIARVREQHWPVVQGNHDLIVGTLDLAQPAHPFGNRARFPDLWWTLDHISTDDRAYLAELPPTLLIDVPAGPPIRLVHGIPGDPFVGFEPGATEANRTKAAGVSEPYLIAAHTHRPMHETMKHLQILNPGGVGISHNGDPRAHYLILHAQNNAWIPDFRVVEYPRAAVRAAFYSTGFMDYAGPMGELHLRTVATGHAWASDFNFWMRDQPPALHDDIGAAVATYLQTFPDEKRWAFPVGTGV